MTARRIPLSVKVPAVVLAFMAMVAFFVSERVLSRLASAQMHHLEDLAADHLDGLATALIQPVLRDDTWEVFDILDRARQSHAGLKPTTTLVANNGGEVLASSDPRAIRSRSPLPTSFLTQAAQRRSLPFASTKAAPSPGETYRVEANSWGRFTQTSISLLFLPSGARCCGHSSPRTPQSRSRSPSLPGSRCAG
jgi:hypothetical protein